LKDRGTSVGSERWTREPRAEVHAREHAVFQSLFLLGVSLTVLPALIEAARGSLAVGSVAAAASGSLLAWFALRRPAWWRVPPQDVALGTALVLTLGFTIVVAVDGPEHRDGYVLVAAAVLCALSAVRGRPRRWATQGLVLVSVGVLLATGSRPWVDLLLSWGGLLVIVGLSNHLAAERISTGLEERRARLAAARRAELLDTVRELEGSDLAAASAIIVRTLRALGFDEAGVTLLDEDGELRRLDLEGSPAPDPRSRVTGLTSVAVGEDRTVVSTDAPDPRRLARHPGDASVVVAPIRVAGVPAGALVGSRADANQPSSDEIEAVEVLAAHLGRAVHADAQVVRQHEVLQRMAELERMRTGFVAAVSGELRDPLTVVRGAGQTLALRGDGLDPAVRRGLLEHLCAQAGELRGTIDSLLDFSHFQAARAESDPEVMPVSELLAPVFATTGAVAAPGAPVGQGASTPAVEADPSLTRHALELLVADGGRGADAPPVVVHWEDRPEGVAIVIERADAPVLSSLVSSLVSQLVIAAGGTLETGPPVVMLLPKAEHVPGGRP
jgi:signal transduction histidine kinase